MRQRVAGVMPGFAGGLRAVVDGGRVPASHWRHASGTPCKKQVLLVLQNIAGLALERLADGFERGEADGFGFAVFQDRDVGDRDADAVGEFGDAHLALRQHDVDVDDDGHASLVTR